MKQPNILFLMSDEHRPDVTGYEGNAVVRTPVLDELAATGVTFRNAYTPWPSCVPARHCMATGQLRKTGRWGDQADIPPGSMTFARRFSQHAYYTACCGKLHHRGADAMQGWTQRIGGDVIVDPRLAYPGCKDDAFARYTPSLRKQKWSNAKEVARAGIGRGYASVQDEFAAQGALDLIERHIADPWYDRARPQQPMLLMLSLMQPHYPYQTSESKFTYYLNRVEPFLETAPDHAALAWHRVAAGEAVTERDVRRATAAYYGMVETIDETYGRVQRELQRVGQNLDDWIIVYCSDHGEMLGQHGVWEKQCFYEASVRVPLIIRPPLSQRDAWQCAGRRVDENVNLCDLFATLCELSGIDMPASEHGFDSRSLVPLMRGESDVWHDRYHNETVSQAHDDWVMIKRDALKYQWYSDAAPEVLFDLQRDPGERVNVIDEPKYADAVACFRTRRDALGFGPDADPNYRNAGYDAAPILASSGAD